MPHFHLDECRDDEEDEPAGDLEGLSVSDALSLIPDEVDRAAGQLDALREIAADAAATPNNLPSSDVGVAVITSVADPVVLPTNDLPAPAVVGNVVGWVINYPPRKHYTPSVTESEPSGGDSDEGDEGDDDFDEGEGDEGDEGDDADDDIEVSVLPVIEPIPPAPDAGGHPPLARVVTPGVHLPPPARALITYTPTVKKDWTVVPYAKSRFAKIGYQPDLDDPEECAAMVYVDISLDGGTESHTLFEQLRDCFVSYLPGVTVRGQCTGDSHVFPSVIETHERHQTHRKVDWFGLFRPTRLTARDIAPVIDAKKANVVHLDVSSAGQICRFRAFGSIIRLLELDPRVSLRTFLDENGAVLPTAVNACISALNTSKGWRVWSSVRASYLAAIWHVLQECRTAGSVNKLAGGSVSTLTHRARPGVLVNVPVDLVPIHGSWTSFSLTKVRAVNCGLEEEFSTFVPSGDVEMVKCKGEAWFKNGLCWFSKHEGHFLDATDHPNVDGDQFYRTNFGPIVAHSSITYAACDRAMALASMRLLGALENDLPLQVTMRVAQRGFIENHQPMIELLRASILPYLADYQGIFEAAREHHADPHAKRDLRIVAWREILESGEVFDELWFGRPGGSKTLVVKLKREEFAKWLKKPRCIGDLGVAASLQGFVYTKLLKEAFAGMNYRYAEVNYRFVPSPGYEPMCQAFDELIAPVGRGQFTCFSDDACFSIRIHGKVYRANLDIKSCDKSHGDAVFELFRDMGLRDVGATLIAQCKSDFKIHRYKNGKLDKRTYVKLRPKKHMLFSGSTITTAINNLANWLIYLSLAEADFSQVNNEEAFAEVIKQAGRRAGYLLEVGVCTEIEDLQFLKHSPHQDVNGCWKPVLNLGVYFRSCGRCKGDLPGRGDQLVRANEFNRQHLNGTFPRLVNSFVTELKERFAFTGANAALTLKVAKRIENIAVWKAESPEEHPPVHVSLESWCRRYRAAPMLAAELMEFAKHARVGLEMSTPALDHVMFVDYGQSGVAKSV